MERIHYAGDSLLTGSAISRSLLEYAEALAIKDSSATVDIPIRNADGSQGRANFLVGPASQIFAEEELSEYDEIVDEELVAQFQHEVRALRGVPVTPSPASEYSASSVDDLDLPTTEDNWES